MVVGWLVFVSHAACKPVQHHLTERRTRIMRMANIWATLRVHLQKCALATHTHTHTHTRSYRRYSCLINETVT